MSSLLKGSKDPAAVNARLEETLAELQGKRAILATSLRTILKPEQSPGGDVETAGVSNSEDVKSNFTTLSTTSAKPSEDEIVSTLSEAQAVVKRHITLLHRYNEIKDVGQGLLGLIAEQRGVRVVDVMEEFGVGVKD